VTSNKEATSFQVEAYVEQHVHVSENHEPNEDMVQGKSDTSFCMPLENVTNEVLRPSPRESIPYHQPVLEPVNNALDIEAVSCHPTQQTSYVTIDPKLQRELDLVEHLVVAGKDVDVPYTPYLTKCQWKKIAKAAIYKTCSMGPPPSPSKLRFPQYLVVCLFSPRVLA